MQNVIKSDLNASLYFISTKKGKTTRKWGEDVSHVLNVSLHLSPGAKSYSAMVADLE